jgi:hypothetical protein
MRRSTLLYYLVGFFSLLFRFSSVCGFCVNELCSKETEKLLYKILTQIVQFWLRLLQLLISSAVFAMWNQKNCFHNPRRHSLPMFGKSSNTHMDTKLRRRKWSRARASCRWWKGGELRQSLPGYNSLLTERGQISTQRCNSISKKKQLRVLEHLDFAKHPTWMQTRHLPTWEDNRTKHW